MTTITEVINTDYKQYAMYVLENRAIPSVIDGFKPVHRILLYSMLNEHKGKKTKLADLSGISKFGYHHGESSAAGAAVTLTAPWNNNVPLFQAHGNFGSRLIQEAAAARYIFASLGENFAKYFGDHEVVDKNKDRDAFTPQTYLPYIPWVLVNGIEGIAVGFACRFLPHDPKALAESCLLALQQQKSPSKYPISVIPSFPGFTGSVVQESDTKYITRGVVSRTARNTWQITEAPWGYDREQLFDKLVDLQEAGKIVDFSDDCDSSGFNFSVKVDTETDKKLQAGDPIAFFKLEKSFTENYTTLDETGKLKIFATKDELIRYFVAYRLTKVEQKIKYDYDKAVADRDWASKKLSFVSDVSKGIIKLQDKNKADWLIYCKDKYKATQEEAAKLLQIPVVDMTSDHVQALYKKVDAFEKERIRIAKLKPATVYADKLKELCK